MLKSKPERRLVTIATGVFLPFAIAAMAAVTMVAGTPSSLPLLLAGFRLSVPGIALYFLAPLASFPLLVHLGRRRGNRVAKSSLLVFTATVVASIWHFRTSWAYGMRYQGDSTTIGLASLDCITVIILAGILARNKRRPSHRSNVLFNWLLMVWITAWSFPYLGESP